MSDEPDAFEEALRASQNIAPGSAGDEALAAAEKEAEQAAADAVRERIYSGLLTAAKGLKPGSSFEQLIRQACFANLAESQLEALHRAIHYATRTTLSALKKDQKRIERDVAATRRKQAQDEVARKRLATGDPLLDKVQAEYPPPKGFIYMRIGSQSHVAIGEAVIDTSGEAHLRPLATPFVADARLDLPDGGEGLRIRVRNSRGQRRTVHVDGADLGTAQGLGKVIAAMTSAGFVVLGGKRAREKVADILAAADPDKVIKVVNRPGFHLVDKQRCYLTVSGEVIGNATDEIELNSALAAAKETAKGGTFDGWLKQMEEIAALDDVPHWQLAPMIGFAGLLVDYLGLPTMIINLQGKTSIGKSTAQMLAVSVSSVPLPRDGSLMWDANATLNSTELAAEWATGGVLAIDETKLLSGAQLNNLIFRLAGGISRGRLSGSSSAGYKAAARRAWRTMILLSSEHVLASKIDDDRDTQLTTGALVRALDLQLDGHVKEFASTDVPSRIQDTIKANYGFAGPKLAQALLDAEARLATSGQDFRADLNASVKNEAQKFARAEATPAELRTLTVFGLLKVAGKLAIHLGLLPKKLNVEATVDWAFKTFISGTELDVFERAIDNIRTAIDRAWGISIVHCETPSSERGIKPEAYYDNQGIYVLRDFLKPFARVELDGATIAKEFKRRGMLVESMLAYDRKLKGGRGNFTRRVPCHGGIAAYPLKRDVFSARLESKRAGAAELLQKMLDDLHRHQTEYRERYGEQRYEDMVADIKRKIDAAQVADAGESAAVTTEDAEAMEAAAARAPHPAAKDAIVESVSPTGRTAGEDPDT